MPNIFHVFMAFFKLTNLNFSKFDYSIKNTVKDVFCFLG